MATLWGGVAGPEGIAVSPDDLVVFPVACNGMATSSLGVVSECHER